MEFIEIDKKFFKNLMDVNDVMRKAVASYVINVRGIAYTNLKNVTAKYGGYHFGQGDIIKTVFESFKTLPDFQLAINSATLATIDKDFKRAELKQVGVDESLRLCIVTTDGQTHPFGQVVQAGFMEEDQNKCVNHASQHDSTMFVIDTEMLSCIKNGDVILLKSPDNANHQLKISKDIFPALNKDATMSVSFIDMEPGETFQVTFSCLRAGVELFHVYPCSYL